MQEPAQTDPAALNRTTYDDWMGQEGIPVAEHLAGVDDLTALPRRPWARTGGLGTFVQMLGPVQAERGLYVLEIPAGKALEPERHMYEEVIFILKGRGVTEVWYEGQEKRVFEWGEGSLFSPPLNTWHRLVNGSQQPTIFLGITTAPRVMGTFRDAEFVFNCDYRFLDRFSGESDYFAPKDERMKVGKWSTIMKTNFIPDAKAVFLDDLEQKVAGGQLTGYRMAGGFPNGHISEWPVGRYHKAHYHGPGAILIGLQGKGYVNVWSSDLGTRPFQDGHGDEVLEIQWAPGSIYSPPDAWFHQHMSTGKEPARHVAVYGNTSSGRWDVRQRLNSMVESRYTSIEDGGTLIEYELEDPEIRRRFEEALRGEGVECTMPPVTYRQQ